MRQFYQVYTAKVICQKPSGKLKCMNTNTNYIQQKPSAKSCDFTSSYLPLILLVTQFHSPRQRPYPYIYFINIALTP